MHCIRQKANHWWGPGDRRLCSRLLGCFGGYGYVRCYFVVVLQVYKHFKTFAPVNLKYMQLILC